MHRRGEAEAALTGAEARSVDANGRLIRYELRRSERRTLSISVEPDARVVVIAPHRIAGEVVDARIQRRAGWIRQQQLYFEALPPPPQPRRWAAGETHRYLGKQYRLKLVTGSQLSVRLLGGYFVVTTRRQNDPSEVEAAMNGWYRARARDLLLKRLVQVRNASTWLSLPETPSLSIRRMRLRWGSTTPGGRICLNVDLVKLPLGCIDYVLAHELVHLQIPNHGPKFWRLLERVFPQWEHWRHRLAMEEH
jgi:predicted metal-dependent hydrolase